MKKYVNRRYTDWVNWEGHEYTTPVSKEFEDIWSYYLSGPEDEVNTELQIFLEPSTQGRGSIGSMLIFDESGKDRFEDVSIDFGELCKAEMKMAIKSNNAAEYKQRYRAWIKSMLGI